MLAYRKIQQPRNESQQIGAGSQQLKAGLISNLDG